MTPPQWKILKNNQAGAVIVVIVVTMTIVAILGAAMLYLVSSSSFSELFINNREKAYYLAQAGRQYATMIINSANIAGDPTPITNLNNQTFTLADGNKFYLRTNQDDVKYTVVESTGIVNQNTVLETKQKIMLKIPSIKFSSGIYGILTVTLNKDSYVDTYDSRNGPYTFATHTANATVQTNRIGSNSIVVNSGVIFGNAIVGVGGNPATDIFVNKFGQITGTRTAATQNKVFNAVTLPPGGTSIANITLLNTTQTLTAGTYRTGKVDLNGQAAHPAILTISGKVVLLVENTGSTGGTLSMIGYSYIVVQPGGGLELYVTKSLFITDNSRINPPCPPPLAGPVPVPYPTTCASPSPATAVRMLGIDMSTLSYSKASQTYGGIYAPGAAVNIDSTSQLFGAIIAKTIDLSGTGTIGVNPTGSVHIDTGFALLEGLIY